MKIRLILLYVIIGFFSACNERNVVKDEDFVIAVNNITDRSVSIKIIPSDKKAYYNWDIQSSSWFEEHKDSIGEYYKAKWDDWYANGTYSREDENGYVIDSAEDLYYHVMSKGTTQNSDFDMIKPSTDYVAFAYYHEADFHVIKITTLTFRSPQAELMEDMIVQFSVWPPDNPENINISLNNIMGDSLFYGSISTNELGKREITEYAEQLFDECMMKGGELKEEHCSWMGYAKLPYPEEPQEWFGCSFYNNTRTSKWFFFHTPK